MDTPSPPQVYDNGPSAVTPTRSVPTSRPPGLDRPPPPDPRAPRSAAPSTPPVGGTRWSRCRARRCARSCRPNTPGGCGLWGVAVVGDPAGQPLARRGRRRDGASPAAPAPRSCPSSTTARATRSLSARTAASASQRWPKPSAKPQPTTAFRRRCSQTTPCTSPPDSPAAEEAPTPSRRSSQTSQQPPAPHRHRPPPRPHQDPHDHQQPRHPHHQPNHRRTPPTAHPRPHTRLPTPNLKPDPAWVRDVPMSRDITRWGVRTFL